MTERMATVALAAMLAMGCDSGGGDSGSDSDAGGDTAVDPGSDTGTDPGVDTGTDPGTDGTIPPPGNAYDCVPEAPAGETFWVATDGSDDTGDGSEGAPWATITHALDSVPDGSLVLVRPGLYEGRIRMRGNFAEGVEVRSEVPYRAVLRHSGTVMTFYEHGDGVGI